MILEPETRKGYYISSETKKLWAVEMELLKKLLDVCKKHNLKIWASGGTLLGAVREHGFIPWDDDIDMAMLREDYDKLQIVAKTEFHDPFFFQSGFTDFFPRGFSKLRMNGTAAIEKGYIFSNMHQGIFIDIFVYDEIPDDVETQNSFVQIIQEKECVLQRYCYESYRLFHPFYSIKLFLFKLPIYLKGFKCYFKEYDSTLKQHSGTNITSLCFLSDYKRCKRNISDYDNTLYVPFEDILIPIPSSYDIILRNHFGDYMVPVKGASMHSFIIFDADKSYLDYLPKLRSEKRRKRWIDRKNWLIRFMRFNVFYLF